MTSRVWWSETLCPHERKLSQAQRREILNVVLFDLGTDIYHYGDEDDDMALVGEKRVGTFFGAVLPKKLIVNARVELLAVGGPIDIGILLIWVAAGNTLQGVSPMIAQSISAVISASCR